VSFEWTRAHIQTETKRVLAGLPFRIDVRPRGGHVSGPTVTLVHATAVNNLVYLTEDRSDEFLTNIARQAHLRSGDVICFGHTHKPWHRAVDGIHFVNTGSVGRPKDGDARAGYVLLTVTDAEAGIDVQFVRVEYDIEAAARAVIEAGLPEEFAEFLRSGGGTPAAQPGVR
jgi:diadenosine tetraphosphatase ApaH/serine/threonine PP2A family protein phosphatase